MFHQVHLENEREKIHKSTEILENDQKQMLEEMKQSRSKNNQQQTQDLTPPLHHLTKCQQINPQIHKDLNRSLLPHTLIFFSQEHRI